jgi:16S rRNA (guanine1207-N2)-methyltransferase
MTEHYYTNNPQVTSKEEQIQVTLRGNKLTFSTDRGVFSKAGIDFGSQLLVESVEVAKDAKILDVGCGYGTIGLALAKESDERQVTLIDVNQRALSLVDKNAQANGIKNIRIVESDLYKAIDEQDYDLIISNPPIRAGKDIIHQLLEESYQYLKVGGQLWIVIQKKQGSPSAFKKLEERFEKVNEVTKKKGYRIFKAEKWS